MNVFLDCPMGTLYVNLYIENILYETIQIKLNPAKCYSEILHLPLIEQKCPVIECDNTNVCASVRFWFFLHLMILNHRYAIIYFKYY